MADLAVAEAMEYGVGLNHLPSGRFAANGAWLAVHGSGLSSVV
jgi:hypothetical protein